MIFSIREPREQDEGEQSANCYDCIVHIEGSYGERGGENEEDGNESCELKGKNI